MVPEDATEVERQNHCHQFLQENNERLIGIISAYVVRMGLASGEKVKLLATEVFQDAALELLAHSERLDPERPPHAWFLRIAANILKRHRAAYAKRYRFEVLVSDLADRRQAEDEDDLLDRLITRNVPGPEHLLEARERTQEMLALVSTEDAEILDLALLQDLRAEDIATRLGLKTGNVRVRLHRAQQRLRVAWKKREAQEKRGQHHA